jgi:hypothetical protein
MAAKKEITGGPLTAKERITAEANDPEGVKEVMNSLEDRAGSPEQILQSWAEVCRTALLERFPSIDVDPRRVEEGVEQAGLGHPAPEWYCAQIINHVHVLGRVLDNVDAWTAVSIAFRLGRLTKELQILGFEEPLASGMKVVEGGKKGVHARDSGKADRNLRIKDKYAERRAAGQPQHRIFADLKREVGLSSRQLERILQKKLGRQR